MRSPTVETLAPEIDQLVTQRDYRSIREGLRGLPHADTADILESLTPGDMAIAFRMLPHDDAAGVFADLSSDAQEDLIGALGDTRAIRVVEEMEPDDRARLLDELPAQVSTRLLGRLAPATRRETQVILGYGPEQVGRLMTPDYVRVKPHWTVAKALEHIRRFGSDAETLYWVFVVDQDLRLIDDIYIRQLLLADADDTIAKLMDNQFVALDATADREEAVRAFARYDRTALPVIDARGTLVGIVTHDDIADVAEVEATEDIHKLGGAEALTQPYLETHPIQMVRKRGPWLISLFTVQLVTVGVMAGFEDQLAEAVVLALFVPLIISTGGNTGTQTSSMLVRAIALREVSLANWAKVVKRELATALTLGLTLGVYGFAITLVLTATGFAESDTPARVGLAIAASIGIIVVWAVLAGSLLPLMLERLGFDPASSSAPLVATIMDISGLLIYLLISSAVVAAA
jgi:magnesium transporter